MHSAHLRGWPRGSPSQSPAGEPAVRGQTFGRCHRGTLPIGGHGPLSCRLLQEVKITLSACQRVCKPPILILC